MDSLWRLREGGHHDAELGVALAALIFLRWADFQESEQEAMASFDDTDYTSVLPFSLHWRSWQELSPGDLYSFLGKQLPSALRGLHNARHNSLSTHLHRLSEPLEMLRRLSAEGLSVLVRWLSNQDFETPNDRRKLLGYFDEFLSATTHRFSGEYRTPPAIANLIVELAAPSAGERIYDPCFGTAGLLTTAFNFVLRQETSRQRMPRLAISGVERNQSAYVIGLARLVLAGIDDPQLELGNSLERTPPDNPQRDGFDLILANPPWGMRVEAAGLSHFPLRTNDATGLFLQHALAQLRPEGRAVIIVPQGFLFRNSGQKLRRMLVEQHSIEAIISLPETVFIPYSGAKSSILILKRSGPTRQVRMLDAEPYFEKAKGRLPATITNISIQQLVGDIRSAKPDENWWDLDVHSLAEIEWDLTPHRRDRSSLLVTLESVSKEVEIAELKDCCTIISGSLVRSEDLLEEPVAEHSIPYVRIKDVQRGQAAKGSSWLSAEAASSLDKKWKLRAGDVLLSKSGTIGKIGLVRNGAVGAVAASGFFVLRADQHRLDPHFLVAFLDSAQCRSWLDDHSYAAVTIRHLRKQVIGRLPIPLPPLALQRRIAAQYREEGVDTVAFLAKLLTEHDVDPVAQWLERALRELPSGPDITTKDLDMEPLDRLATAVQSLRNQVVHSPQSESPLTPWLIAFAEGVSTLKGVRNVPQGPAMLGLLQEVAWRLRVAGDYIRGQQAIESGARTLNSLVAKWIESIITALLHDVKLAITAETDSLKTGAMVEIDLRVQNQSMLPLRDVRVLTEPDWGQGRFTFLAEKDSANIHLKGAGPKVPGTFTITAQWSGLTLDGQQTSGKQEIAFDVLTQERSEATQTTELGGSPYVCGGEIFPTRNDVFFGRDHLLDQIRRQVIQSGNVVLLEGNRRSGKSSILRHLEGLDPVPGWLGIYCSLQGAKGSKDGVGVPTVEVFREIANSIVKGIQSTGRETPLPDGSTMPGSQKLGIAKACRLGISEESPFADFREYIEIVLDVLAQQGLGLLLMLDEFDKLQEGIDRKITSPQVPENIRFLVQAYSRFSAILTGSHRLKRLREEYWSALFGLGTRFGVTSLPQEAARRLVLEPVRGRLAYSPEAVERAIFLTAGQPYLLQCLCNQVFNLAAHLKTHSVTLDLVEKAGDALVVDNEHFATLWGYAKSDRRRFMLSLCHREAESPDMLRLGIIQEHLSDYGIEVHDETLIADLDFLRELELIELSSETGEAHYRLAIPLMGMWISRQHDFAVLRSKARIETEDQRD